MSGHTDSQSIKQYNLGHQDHLSPHTQLTVTAITSIFSKTSPKANTSFCVSSANLLGSVAVQVIHHHPQLFWDVHRLFSLSRIITHVYWHQGLREGSVGRRETNKR